MTILLPLTHAQRSVLVALHEGQKFVLEPSGNAYLDDPPCQRLVRRATLAPLFRRGWIAREPQSGRIVLTLAGKPEAEILAKRAAEAHKAKP